MLKEYQSRKEYPSDLTDSEQWTLVEPLLPPLSRASRRRPRQVDMREVLNTIRYLHRSGCQWDMLPHELLPKSTAYDYFAQWRDDSTWGKVVTATANKRAWLRDVSSRRVPSGSMINPVKTTEIGGPERGYDGGKRVKGRKRHILVDTLGLLSAVLITSAGLDDGSCPAVTRADLGHSLPRLRDDLRGQ